MEKIQISDQKLVLLTENDEEIGFVKFTIDDKTLHLKSTVVHEAFQGKGYAKRLMQEIEKFITEKHYALVAECSYAVKYFGKV